MSARPRALLLGTALLLAPGTVASADEPTVTPSWDQETFVNGRTRIELRLSRPLAPEEGRLAAVLGALDLSDLLRQVEPGRYVYGPAAPPLPAGEAEVVVSRVSPGGAWTEIGRLRLKVRTAGGFDSVTVAPAADLANKGQVAEGHHPDEPAPPRATFQDLTAQLGWRTEHVRGDLAIRTNVNVTAVTFLEEALRFGTLGAGAPRADLAAWGVELQKGWAKVTLGAVSAGTERHLLNAFGSRGIVLRVAPGRVFSLEAGVANGTAIVGWDNVLGVAEAEHRMRFATLGLELVPSRPNGFRVELSWLDGSVQPVPAFTQGAVQSAEKSEGGAARLILSDAGQHLLLDAGFARSRFRAAADPQLEEGLDVRSIPAKTRDARYADLTVSPFAGLSVAFHHERVDPQYRSVAVGVQADRLQNGFEVNGTFGALSLAGSGTWSEDNLDEVPSILNTKTNRAAANVALTLPVLFASGGAPASWLPTLTVGADRTHQYGVGTPTNADAVGSFIPDQVSANALGQAAWQLGSVQVGYQLGWSFQDNRQEGREAADLRNTTNAITLALAPAPSLGLNAEAGIERADSLETGTSVETRRLRAGLSWQPLPRTTVLLNVSTTLGRDRARTSESDATELSAEASQGFALGRLLPFSAEGVRGRAFVRYSSHQASSFDQTIGIRSATAGWQWNTGVTLSLF